MKFLLLNTSHGKRLHIKIARIHIVICKQAIYYFIGSVTGPQ